MRPNNPVVFHPDVANALDGICSDVREKFTNGNAGCAAMETFDVPLDKLPPYFQCTCDNPDECGGIKEVTREIVVNSPSWSRHVLQLVFENVDAIVLHVVTRLQEESHIMRTPAPLGKAILCFRLAVGYSHEELARTSGFAKTTIEITANLNAGFVDYLREQMEKGTKQRNQIWHILEELWARWIDGSLMPESYKTRCRVFRKLTDNEIEQGEFLYHVSPDETRIQVGHGDATTQITVMRHDLRFNPLNF